ncbi:hypothetical protein [Devosia sp. 66-22]|nr:hypothetical protein [Devosia sp. 66-22]
MTFAAFMTSVVQITASFMWGLTVLAIVLSLCILASGAWADRFK